MGFLDSIERLITEHGSAAILKERIGLANDKYAALESRLKDAESRCETLSTENARLAARVAELEPIQKGALSLDPLTEQALLFVSKASHAYAAAVASRLAISDQLARNHLELLADAGLLHFSLSASPAARNEGPRYSLSSEGRRFLAERQLL